ncbi:ATP synthase subunit I [Ursidibacter sp. B-7004-1]
MSIVIRQTRQLYYKVISIEIVLLLILFCSITFFYSMGTGLSFLVGSLASLLPHCLFVYWIFFRQSTKNTNKMTAFYRGEGLKWLLTIVLIMVAFKSYPTMNFLAFFVGYFFMLLCNSLLPILLKLRAK